MAGGDYGRIRHTFWTDPDIKRLPLEKKALLLYYFTSPHSSLIGLYYCPFGYVAVETGLSVEQVQEWTLGPLARYVSYDLTTEEVFVHRAGRHQVGDELKPGDRRVKAAQKAVNETHSARLVAKFLELYAAWPLGIEAPEIPDEEAPSKPLRSQSSAVAVQCNNKAAAEPLPGRDELRAACEEFVRENGYGPKEQLIASGDDSTAWNTSTGQRAPWEERLRLLKLAHAHLTAPGTKARDLRGALGYVILQQFDPIKRTAAEDLQSRPAPGSEAAAVRGEMPVQHRTGPATSDLDRLRREKRAAQESEYTQWRDRIRFRLNAEPQDVKDALAKQVADALGDTVKLLGQQTAARTAEAKLLEIYGKRIGDPQPSVAA